MDGRSYSNRRLKMVLNLDGNPIPLREKGKTKVAFADSGYEAFRKKSQTIEEVRKSIQYVLSMLKENKQVKSALREEIEQEFNQEERGSIGDDIEIFEKYINRLAEGAPLRLATAYEYAKAKDITFYVMTKNEKKRYYLNRQFSHLHAAEVNGNEKEKEKEKEKENSGEKDLVEEIVYVAWTGEQLVGMEANVPQQMQTIILEDDAMEMVPLEDDHDDEKRKDETEIPSLQEAYFNGTDINPFLTAKYERMMKIIREKSANLHEILKLDLDKELEDHGDMVDLDVTHQADSLFKRKNVVLQKNGLARVLCDTLKMEGEKRYFDFILLLINEKSQELKKLASQQLMRRFDQEEDVSVLLSLHLIAEAQYALLSMVYRVLENGFSSNEAYQDAVLQGIHGGSGVKAEMQERFLTHISRFINTYLVEKGGLTEKQAQERIRREMDRVNTYLGEFWSASNTQFPNEFVIEDIRSTEQKLEWREGCKQRMLVRKKESIRGWYFYELNILGRDKMEDSERQGLTQRYNKIKEESAQRLWRKRHSMMPKCLLQAWGSEQEFKTAVIREHVDTDYKEEITGNNLALLSIKYNNHLVYQYLIKRSSLPDEELCRHNAKGLSLSDYRALLLKNKDQGTYERARVKIDSAEPDHDFLLELEKLLRRYLDQWHGRKHKREIHEDSNNPFLQLENLFTQLREWGKGDIFKEHKEVAESLLKEIEAMWQGPHNVSEFLQKFIDLKSRLKDGNLSLFRHGQLSRIFEVVEDHLDPSRMLQLTSSSPIVVSWQQAISQANLYREEKERLQEKNRKKRNEQKKQIEWLEGELSQLKAKIIELEKENVRLNDKLNKSSNEKEESLSSEPQKEGEEKKPRPGML